MTTPASLESGVGGMSQKLEHTQRARWATRKMTIKSSHTKRLSLINRMQHRRALSNEKNTAGGQANESPLAGSGDGHRQNGDKPQDDTKSRALYFNLDLPDELLEDGHPLQSFPRNKIRTAKYTPLSFVPKNLWFQFHNVANIFFLFLVILVVSITVSYQNS